MIGKALTLGELGTYLRGLPHALEKAVVRGLQVGAERALAIAVTAGDTAPPASPNGKTGAFDTGGYRRRWRTRHLKDGAVLYNDAGHADVIERGRRSGRRMPPRRVIERWAQRRLGLSADEAKLAAYPIARAIARRGLAGRFPLKRAEPDVVHVVLEEVKAEVSKALRHGAGGGE